MAIWPSGALQQGLFSHENTTRAPRAHEGPDNLDRGPRVGPPIGGPRGVSSPARLTEHFTASTCRSCSRITIAGLWNGLRIDLEPLALTDVGEYLAIRDGVKTWNLWSDRVATTRDLASIQHPTITDRHAQHSCQADYGTEPPTRRRTWESPQVPDEPPF